MVEPAMVWAGRNERLWGAYQVGLFEVIGEQEELYWGE